MIKNTLSLPDNYSEIFKLDLQNDKKTALLVNAFSFFIFAFLLMILFYRKYGIIKV